MHRSLIVLLLFVSVVTLRAADPPKPNTLTPQEIADGWVLLFDGETAFGWKVDGEAKVKDGILTLGGAKEAMATLMLPVGELYWEYLWSPSMKPKLQLGPAHPGESWSLEIGFSGSGKTDGKTWNGQRVVFTTSASETSLQSDFDSRAPSAVPAPGMTHTVQAKAMAKAAIGRLTVPSGKELSLRNVKFKPSGLQPIFNGKDLSGWKVFPGERYKSKFSVTPEGWLNVTNGPGDLQTEGKWSDFIFQGECISNGAHLNSGIFFRCLPDQYQNGYEMQIRNQWQGDDRTKPVDFGTGAIYRRQPARKVVSSDYEWFAMTLLAHGNHLATWINGYQVVDWTDTRPADPNPRNGSKVEAGHLSIQGHDPTTNLSFRNLRIAELNKEK